jgi:hypothetical protein
MANILPPCEAHARSLCRHDLQGMLRMPSTWHPCNLTTRCNWTTWARCLGSASKLPRRRRVGAAWPLHHQHLRQLPCLLMTATWTRGGSRGAAQVRPLGASSAPVCACCPWLQAPSPSPCCERERRLWMLLVPALLYSSRPALPLLAVPALGSGRGRSTRRQWLGMMAPASPAVTPSACQGVDLHAVLYTPQAATGRAPDSVTAHQTPAAPRRSSSLELPCWAPEVRRRRTRWTGWCLPWHLRPSQVAAAGTLDSWQSVIQVQLHCFLLLMPLPLPKSPV